MITTKKGDKGKTICKNMEMDKDDVLIETVGSIDELQAILELINEEEEIIDDLGQIMGELGSGILFLKYEIRIKKMEEEIKKLSGLKKFMKFNNDKALKLNWARTVCRRTERIIVSLSKKQKVNENLLVYFNRLSDYLFIKAIREN